MLSVSHNEHKMKKRGNRMISFEPLRKLMEEKKATTYTLREKAGLSSSTVYRLINNESVSTNALDALCKTFNCKINDIAEYIPDEK